MDITIAVCTRRRPAMLKNCLESLITQIIPPTNTYSILVVENDDAASMKELVGELNKHSQIPLHYTQEPMRGIPYARNRALKEAEQTDALIFIDDDEIADKDWLSTLTNYAEKFKNQAIIYGHVISDFPAESPAYLHSFIQMNPIKTGTELRSCATNNVWIPIEIVKQLNLCFDVSITTGGDDSQFFCDATEKGGQIISCHEAVVHESIPSSRVSVNWIAKRKFRIGLGKMVRKLKQGESLKRLLSQTIIRVVFRAIALILPIYWINKYKRAKQWFKVCHSAGALVALAGYQVDAYKKVDGI
jgi:succinoglycan biosynthesis protein ExoM